MAEFLARFNFGARDDFAPDDEGACASVSELEQRFRSAIEEKTTEVRAERVSMALEIAATAEFSINATQLQAQDNDTSNVDPSLMGTDPMEVETDKAHQSQMYTTLEVLRSQPSSNPSTQQAVAGLIVEAASAADSSSWMLHQSEMAPSGWIFTFLCAGSTAVWKMQNQGKIKSVVGDYSKKDPDPVLFSRPAFDCKGRITVSFPKKERRIIVRYDHMPLHKTVADHVEFMKPPPMIGPQKPSKATLAEAARKAQKEAAKARRIANRQAKRKEAMEAAAQDGTPKPKRSRKKKDKEVQLSLADQASRALEDADVIQLQQAITHESQQNGGGTAGQAATSAAAAAAAAAAGDQPRPASKALVLNVSPEEAARRMDVAQKMLIEAGINHASLSADQLAIFANQAPDLQKESLNMLITYGAERLQIIHPSNRENSNSAPPPTNTRAPGDEDGNNGPATTTKQLALGDETPIGKGKTRPLGKSRLACFHCKSFKVKCPKERPVCTECQTSGRICQYPPQVPRKRKTKSDAVVAEHADADADADADGNGDGDGDADADGNADGDADDEDDDAEADPADATVAEIHEENAPEQHDATQTQQEQASTDYQYPEEQYSSYHPAPAADIPAPAAQMISNTSSDPVHGVHERPPQLPYFQSASGLSIPQPDPLDEVPRSLLNSDLELPQSSMYFPMYTAPAPAPAPAPATATSTATSTTTGTGPGPGTGTGTAPAAATESQHEREEVSFEQNPVANRTHQARRDSNDARRSIAAASPAWSQSTNLPALAKTSTSHISPPIRHGLPKTQQSPDQVAATLHRYQMQDAHLLAHAASNNQRYTPNSSVKMHHHPPAYQTSTNKSPFQPMYNPRSKSQQGHRGAESVPQRASSAFQVPPDPGSGSNLNHNTNNNNNNSLSGLLSTGGHGSNRHSSTANLSSEQTNKIGYKPYSYQRSTSSAHYPSYQYDGEGTTAMTMAGAYQSLTAHSSSWSDHRGQIPTNTTRSGYEQQAHQGHQGHQQQQQQQQQQGQNWQGLGNPSQSDHNSQGQQRQGFDWGMHDGWNRGH